MMADLQGKRALVTGGNRGIGLAIVQALLAAGAEVTFTTRKAEGLDAAPGAEGVICDITSESAVRGLVSRGFDIVVNNAAMIGPIGHVADVSARDWAENITTNLTGAFQVAQAALRGMQARGGGVIVNLSSGAARNFYEGWSAYCAGKAGLAMLTRAIHAEYAASGIRVYGFAPGVVDTGMQGEIRASGMNPVSQIPREALAPPQEAAQAAVWLCTSAAADLAGREVDVRDPALRQACGLPPL